MQLSLGLFSSGLREEGQGVLCLSSWGQTATSGRGEAGSSDTMGEPLAPGRRKQRSRPQQGSQGRGEGALSRLEQRICSLT